MAYENVDTDLINALLGNGRASLRSLAEDLDVSVTTVSNHLNDLKEEGVVEEFDPIVDYGELGYGLTGVLQLKVEGDALTHIPQELRDYDQMISVYEVTGEFDIIGVGKFRDTDDMNDLIKNLISNTEIEQSSTAVVLNAPTEGDQFEPDST